MFVWNRSNTIALAQRRCTKCYGLGLYLARNVHKPCGCVLRAIFSACYARYRHCAAKEKYVSRIALEFIPGRGRNFCWGRPDEEYIADFCLVSRRALSDLDCQVFRLHFLLGGDWKICCRRLGINRGVFFHAVYRIEQLLGRAFQETEPYALFPPDEYFHSFRRACEPTPLAYSHNGRVHLDKLPLTVMGGHGRKHLLMAEIRDQAATG